jgi:hypothetical protein
MAFLGIKVSPRTVSTEAKPVLIRSVRQVDFARGEKRGGLFDNTAGCIRLRKVVVCLDLASDIENGIAPFFQLPQSPVLLIFVLSPQMHSVEHRRAEIAALDFPCQGTLDDEGALELEVYRRAIIERCFDIISFHGFGVLADEFRGLGKTPFGVCWRSNSRRKLKPKVSSEWSGQGTTVLAWRLRLLAAETPPGILGQSPRNQQREERGTTSQKESCGACPCSSVLSGCFDVASMLRGAADADW